MKLAYILIIALAGLAVRSYGQTSFTTCEGDTIRLNSSGASLYEWLPHDGLDHPYSATPLASPAVTTVYRVQQLHTSGNLIANGDFSQGDVGFSSQYHDSTNVIREGYYSIATSPRNAHFAFRACSDHSTGTGNMMIVNGSSQPDLKVWQQDIRVQPHTNYAFSAYVNAGISSGDKAVIQFSINGRLIGDTITILNIPCAWQRFYAVWNSDTATQASIAVVNQNTQLRGNDFALDDILFEQFTTTADSVTVRVLPTPTPPAIPSEQILCQGDTFRLALPGSAGQYIWSTGDTSMAMAFTNSGQYFVQELAANGCISKVSNTLTVSISPKPETPTIEQTAPDTLRSSVDAALYEWTHDGQLMAVQTRAISCRMPGEYKVQCISEDGCRSEWSQTHRVLATASTKPTVSLICLVPNPAQASVILSGLGNTPVMVRAYDALGNRVGQWYADGRTPLPVSGWAPGLYLIEATGHTPLRLQVIR